VADGRADPGAQDSADQSPGGGVVGLIDAILRRPAGIRIRVRFILLLRLIVIVRPFLCSGRRFGILP
jgi:hypothetical protein